MFTGTEWFTTFRMEICIKFMNILGPDAMTLGNHEFDDGGIDGIEKYVKSVNTATVVANANFKKDIGTKKSVILTAQGEKIGVIGALTTDMNVIQNSGATVLQDEVAAINAEAEKLKNQGVGIIIALTHCGYEVDKKIADKCPLVDLVVGGHSHSFLTSDNINPIHPESKSIEGPYPTTIVQSETGKKVPVVQAYAYFKYMGKLDLTVSISS